MARFLEFLSEAGCDESVQAYLTARGFATLKLLAAAATTEDAFVDRIVAPFRNGYDGPCGSFKSDLDPDLLRAQMVVAWQDARRSCGFDAELAEQAPRPLLTSSLTAPLPRGLAPRRPLSRQGSAPALLSGSMGMGHFRDLQAPPARILRVVESFKAHASGGHNVKFTMGSKLTIDTMRPEGAEFGPDVSDKLDQILDRSPKWTMSPKGKGEQVRGAWVPAPGEYVNPATMGKTHPVLPMTGRGWHMGTEQRKSFINTSIAPAPNTYMYEIGKVKEEDPRWSMGGKLAYGSPLGAKKGMSRSLENTQDMLVKGGPAEAPKWSLTKRPESTLVPKKPRAPGPGHYTKADEQGREMFLRKTPSWSMGSSPRFPKEEIRAY